MNPGLAFEKSVETVSTPPTTHWNDKDGGFGDLTDFRAFNVDSSWVVYHIPTNSLISADEPEGQLVLDWMQSTSTSRLTPEECLRATKSISAMREIGSTPKQDDEHRIQRIAISPTLNCNLNCTYCYNYQESPQKDIRKLPDLESAAVRKIYSSLKSLPVRDTLSIALIGGEPLLKPALTTHLIKASRRLAKRHGIKTRYSVTTNGLHLDRKNILKLINDQKITVSVSLDGPQDWNDEARQNLAGKGSYSQVVSSLGHFFANYHSNIYSVRATPRLIPGRLIGTYRHLVELGFNDIAMGSAEFEAKPLSEIERERILDEVQELASVVEADFLAKRLKRFSWFSEAFINLFVGRAKSVVCGAARNYIAFDTFGRMQACHRYMGNDEYELYPTDIVNRDISKNVSSIYHGGKTPHCVTCWARSLCGGECYHVAEQIRSTSDAEKRQLFICEFKRTKYEAAIRSFVRIWRKDPELARQLVFI